MATISYFALQNAVNSALGELRSELTAEEENGDSLICLPDFIRLMLFELKNELSQEIENLLEEEKLNGFSRFERGLLDVLVAVYFAQASERLRIKSMAQKMIIV